MLMLAVLSGQCGKPCPSTPFGSLLSCASLAHFLWPLMHTHLPADPGDWHLLPTCTRSECPGTTMEVCYSLLRSVVLDALVYNFKNLPPRVKIQKSLQKPNVMPHIYRDPASSKGKNPYPLGAFFLPSFFRLGGRTPFQQGLYPRAGNIDFTQKTLIECVGK